MAKAQQTKLSFAIGLSLSLQLLEEGTESGEQRHCIAGN